MLLLSSILMKVKARPFHSPPRRQFSGPCSYSLQANILVLGHGSGHHSLCVSDAAPAQKNKCFLWSDHNEGGGAKTPWTTKQKMSSRWSRGISSGSSLFDILQFLYTPGSWKPKLFLVILKQHLIKTIFVKYCCYEDFKSTICIALKKELVSRYHLFCRRDLKTKYRNTYKNWNWAGNFIRFNH